MDDLTGPTGATGATGATGLVNTSCIPPTYQVVVLVGQIYDGIRFSNRYSLASGTFLPPPVDWIGVAVVIVFSLVRKIHAFIY